MNQCKDTELTFQLMAASFPNALILVNNLGRITFSNNFAERLFKYTKNELIGKTLETLLPYQPKGEHALTPSYFNNPIHFKMGEKNELNAVKKDGTEFPVEVELNPIVTADGTMVSIAIIDAREKIDRQFRLIIESVPNAIILVNSAGKIVMINKQTEKQFGYNPKELIGERLELLMPERYRNNHPQHLNTFFTHPKTVILGKERYFSAMRKDGSEFPVEIGLNPIETAGDTLTLASIIDRTQQHNYEDIIKINAKKIEDKNKELELSEQKLRELNATKDRLFSIIGHDLRGPIGGVKRLIELLVSNFDLTDTESLSQTLQVILKTANTTYDLLENLLLWARSQQNKIVFDPSNCNLYEIIEDNICLLQELANYKQINIINNVPQNLTVYAGVNMLTTVIRNLISNAIKFTPNHKSIDISVSKNENCWIVSVKDEGIGISPENIEKIFNTNENFTTFGTGNEKGSGMGLVLCKEFVEKHGGRIWAESDLGKGSDFKFTLALN